MNTFISGAIMMASWVIGLYFLRFWRHTRDTFFALFSAAFWILGIERIILTWQGSFEDQSFVYLIRFVAFILIITAVVNKNRGAAS